MKTLRLVALLGIFAVFGYLGMSGCGGTSTATPSDSAGGGAGAVGNATQYLDVAEKVSVVDAQDEEADAAVSPFLSKLLSLKKLASDLPEESDYALDPTFVFVQDRSTEVLDTINEILCYIDQTRYDEMLNQGDYLAQIEVSECDMNRDSATSAGEQSQNTSSSSEGANVEYEMATVNSYRFDDSSPQVVSIWFHDGGDDYMPEMTILLRLVITEQKSDANPYGIFKMDFLGVPAEGFEDMGQDGGMQGLVKFEGGEDMSMQGFLRTYYDDSNNVLMQFNSSDPGGAQQLTIYRSPDGSSGSGTLRNYGMFDGPGGSYEEQVFNIAYNPNFFLRGDANNNSVCLNRTDFNSNVWRYGLYQSETGTNPGERIGVNSGFPIRFEFEGNEIYGWAGYHGLGIPESVQITNGQTVYRMEWGPQGGEGVPYQAFIVPGKLIRHTKMSVTLGELAGVPLRHGSCDEQGCTEYRVEWDKTTQKLYKTGIMDQENWLMTDIEPEELVFGQWDWDFNFWSDALRGNGFVRRFDPMTGNPIAFNNSTPVLFHKSQTVYPDDPNLPTTLACFQDCLDANAETLPASSWESGDSSFMSLANMTAPAQLVAGTHYASYYFDGENMVLVYGDQPVIATELPENVQWGAWTGALIDPADLGDLACDWDANQTCPWKAHQELDEYFSWETGPNNWNQLSLLRDESGFVGFDPPLMIEYQNVAGNKFFLEYNGFGDLWGIPGTCVDGDTGLAIDCGEGKEEGSHIRWVPQFSLAAGTEVTDVISDAVYYVKPLEMEQQMKSVDVSLCADLTLVTYDLPDGSQWESPADIGTEPVIETAPAVIGGVVQTSE